MLALVFAVGTALPGVRMCVPSARASKVLLFSSARKHGHSTDTDTDIAKIPLSMFHMQILLFCFRQC